MPTLRLFTAASIAVALAAGPALTADAWAQSKSRATKSSRAKAKAADAAPAEAAAPAQAAAPAEPPAAPEQQIAASNPAATIPAVLQASGQFTTLLKAVQATNLTSVVGGPRPLTVFAPTDQAFAALPPGMLTALLLPANADTLQKILTFHVVATRIPAAQIRGKAASPIPTAGGQSVTVSGVGGTIKVGDATVLQSDVQASNGVIYVIDKVLVPPGLRLPTPAAGAAAPGGATPGAATPGTTAPGATAPAPAGAPTTPAPTAPSAAAAASPGLAAPLRLEGEGGGP